MSERIKAILVLAAVTAAVIIAPIVLRDKRKVKPLFDGKPLEAIIDLGRYADTTRTLLTGYNYYLLEKYAESHNLSIDIRLADRDGAGLDSLLAGAADIVVIPPFADSLKRDSILVSVPVDSISRWMMTSDNAGRMEDFNKWVEAYHNSERFESTREQFLHVYSPFRSRPREHLCPYDSIIKIHADTLGWDWRMLAAIIWQESRFHIEARSRRGAFGLMQMMPKTADRFDVENPLDPGQSIMAGAHYLQFLQNKFRHYGETRNEKYKFVLAAYNAGEGRVQDCIRYALYNNVDVSNWQNIADIIPRMSSLKEEELELLVAGAFKGGETVHYVDNVFAVYDNFCRICPE